MPSNFVDLDQAANMLGVTPEALVEMRSQGEIFGFRDGSSWKFKTDELERVAQERGISLSGSSEDDLSLVPESELDLSKPLFGEDDGSLAPDESDASSIGELLAGDDLSLDLDSDDDADSLLVNDDVPLISDSGGGSTIIGATNNPDSDLQLAVDDDDDVLGSDLNLAGSAVGGSSILGGELDLAANDPGGSDVKLVPSGGEGSDVSVVPDSDELLVGPDASGISGADTGSGSEVVGGGELELGSSADELDLASDLELDSGAGTGDLELETGEGTGDLELSDGSGTGDLELSVGSGTGELELDLDSGSLELDDDLDDDDDLVLGDGSAIGSDVTLGTGDTGINLTSPSDSGLSLEEDPIDISGGPISSLELPDEEIISLEDEADPDAATQLKQDEAFLLSPGDAMEEDDSGSQVIALEDSSQFDQDAATMLGQNAYDDGLQAQVQQQPALDPAAGAMVPAAGGAMAAGAAMGAPGADPNAAAFGAPTSPVVEQPREAPYSIFNVMALMTITGVLGLSGMLMMDVVRNMWAWNADKGPISTSIMDGLLSALGIK